jgi:DNA mismatch endonuclease (patch repair protein)
MADVLTKKQRHYNMSRIRSKNTKPEEIVRKYLFSKGFRYRKNDARYPGKPDIVLPKYKTIIFIHGCFWHQHLGCKAARIPDTNSEFWKSKFEKNIARDAKEKRELEEAGWKVIILWECEISTKKKREIRLPALEDEIKSKS